MDMILLPLLLANATPIVVGDAPAPIARAEAVATVRIVRAEPASETVRKLNEQQKEARSADRGAQITRSSSGAILVEHH